jgi:hypothetical protein
MPYSNYVRYIKQVCDSNDLTSFKGNSEYRRILEHVSQEEGQRYLNAIKQFTPMSLEDIRSFSTLNDSIGGPIKSVIDGLFISPTNLRYIFHSHLIIEHLYSLNIQNIDIVEVGGGYGGLCLALHYFADKYNIKIRTYTIIDLTEPSRLQKIYLSQLHPSNNINFVDAITFGSNIQISNMFLISNYGFSELSDSLQKEYIDKLFPKVSHGFMAWCQTPLYNFGFNLIKEQTEFPLTGTYPGNKHNKYIYF